jgi:hypothetical protein
MPTPDERRKRKTIRDSLRASEIERIRHGLPLEPVQMRSLFQFVEEKLDESDCDHTLRHTLNFLEKLHISSEPVVTWLQNAGGYCDCEVLFNSEQLFESAFPPCGFRTMPINVPG